MLLDRNNHGRRVYPVQDSRSIFYEGCLKVFVYQLKTTYLGGMNIKKYIVLLGSLTAQGLLGSRLDLTST